MSRISEKLFRYCVAILEIPCVCHTRIYNMQIAIVNSWLDLPEKLTLKSKWLPSTTPCWPNVKISTSYKGKIGLKGCFDLAGSKIKRAEKLPKSHNQVSCFVSHVSLVHVNWKELTETCSVINNNGIFAWGGVILVHAIWTEGWKKVGENKHRVFSLWSEWHSKNERNTLLAYCFVVFHSDR